MELKNYEGIKETHFDLKHAVKGDFYPPALGYCAFLRQELLRIQKMLLYARGIFNSEADLSEADDMAKKVVEGEVSHVEHLLSQLGALEEEIKAIRVDFYTRDKKHEEEREFERLERIRQREGRLG